MQKDEPDDSERLFDQLYEDLKKRARRAMKRERLGHTLQPTALVHEVYLRLVSMPDEMFRDPAHFMRTAARAMQQVLIDHARRANALKRPHEARVPLHADLVEAPAESFDVAQQVATFLEQLKVKRPRQAEVVRLRYLAGQTIEQTASYLGVPLHKVNEDWRLARVWLKHAFEASAGEKGDA